MSNTTTIANVRDTEFINVRGFIPFPGRGHCGMNILLGPDEYSPCKNEADTYYAASHVPKGYEFFFRYRDGVVESRTGEVLEHGIFIRNEWDGLRHQWANKATKLAIEAYPEERREGSPVKFGCVRLEITNFSHPAHGGLYCNPPVGRFGFPTSLDYEGRNGATGLPYAIQIEGQVLDHGRPVGLLQDGSPRVNLSFFQMESTNYTVTGAYWVRSFVSTSTSSTGYYDTGPLYPGNYRVYVGDRLTGNGKTFDLRFEQSKPYSWDVADW